MKFFIRVVDYSNAWQECKIQKHFIKPSKYRSLLNHQYYNIISALCKNGLYTQYSIILSKIVLVFNFNGGLKISTTTNDGLGTFVNFIFILNTIIDLIKPPFVVQTAIVPKKLKRKIGLKYLIKIVYKNEISRKAVAIKQIINNSNSFTDVRIQTRLYKSIISTYTLGNESILYKKKLLIFKKFFKN